MRFKESLLKYLQLLSASMTVWLLLILLSGSVMVMAQPSWLEVFNSPLGEWLRRFSLSAGRLAIVMALLSLALVPRVRASIALPVLVLLTVPLLGEGQLEQLWVVGGEFSAILFIPLMWRYLAENRSVRGLTFLAALGFIIATSIVTRVPLVMPPEAGRPHDLFFPLPQGGWSAIVMALIATGAGLAEKTMAGRGAVPRIIRTIRLLLWLLTAAITMPVFWQEPVTLEQARAGQEIFDSGECSDCHSYQTGFRGQAGELFPQPGPRRLIDLTFVHEKFTRESMLFYLAGYPPPGMLFHKPPYDEVFTEVEMRRLSDFLLYLRALPPESGVDAE